MTLQLEREIVDCYLLHHLKSSLVFHVSVELPQGFLQIALQQYALKDFFPLLNDPVVLLYLVKALF